MTIVSILEKWLLDKLQSVGDVFMVSVTNQGVDFHCTDTWEDADDNELVFVRTKKKVE